MNQNMPLQSKNNTISHTCHLIAIGRTLILIKSSVCAL